MKKFILLCLSLCMVFSISCAATFSDLEGNWAKADIEKAIELASDRPRYWEFYGNMLIMSDNEADRDMGFECIATALKLRSEQN